jgi:aryl-alcohol dehydrogenase-like predicted oxidoreductase
MLKTPTDPVNPSRRRLLQASAGCAALAIMNKDALAQKPALQERPVPRSKELVPIVGIGTWQTFDVGPQAPERAELAEVLRRFAGHGGRVVDSSPMYGQAERVVGDLTAEQGLREKLFFATKVWTSGRDAGIQQMENSFRLMRAGRMDLMQVHNLLDVAIHAKTLREWKSAGRIRYLGITHYHAGAHADLERLLKTREWDFAQFNYSLAEPEAETRLLPACAELGVAVIVNRPFAEGALFRRVKGKELPPWAAEIGCASWAQFFLKWILSHPAVTCAIPGTSKSTHLEDNLQAGVGRLPDPATRRRMAEYLVRL